MKLTQQCPKCQSRELWMLDRVQQPNPNLDFGVLPMFLTSCRLDAFERVDVGELEAWICARCGYMEWYAKKMNEHLARLARLPNSGVRWIDTTPQRGPFR